jgi:hypothetical protein
VSSDASLQRIKHLVTNRKCVCIVSIVNLCISVYYLFVVHVSLIYYVKTSSSHGLYLQCGRGEGTT